MTTTQQLASDRWRLWLEPAQGVQWLAAEVLHDGHWVSVVPDCRGRADAADSRPGTAVTARPGQDESAPLAAASFIMLPYSNRVRDGRFTFEGTTYQLQHGDRHAIHGALRKRPWRVVDSAADRLSCEYDSATDGELNWPWPLRASVQHRLDGAVLSSEISLTNTGDTAMPAGLGWHPYFVREINGAGPRLQLPVNAVYPDADGDCLPDGAAEALPAELDFRTARTLDPHQRIDACLAGLQGRCEIAWPDAGLVLSMEASEHCDHLVLYNPAAPHFAVEPVSNANDGFNLQARGIDAGVTSLAPGESLRATLRLRVDG